MKRALLLLCVALSLCSLTWAQQGVPPLGAMDAHDFDAVDLSSNNIMITIPVRTKAGVFPFNGSLIANSNVSAGTGWSVSMDNSAAALSTSAFAFSASNSIGFPGVAVYATSASGSPCGSPPLPTTVYTWHYSDATGAYHPLSLPNQTIKGLGTGCTTSINAVTTDGTGVRISATGNTLNSAIDAKGYSFSGNGQVAAQSRTDRYGNKISFTGCTNTSCVVTDTMGMTVLTAALSGNDRTYSWTDVSSGTAQVKDTQTSQTLKTNFACTSPSITDISPTATNFPTTITLADGRTIGITYEAITGGVTGRVNVITLPTNGTITYTYGGTHGGIDCTYQTPPVLTRTLSNGDVYTYTLTHPLVTGSQYQALNKMVDPGGNETDYAFNGFSSTGNQGGPNPITYVKHFQSNGAGATALSQDTYCYNTAAASCSVSTAQTAVVVFPVTSIVVMHQFCVSSCTGTPVWSSASLDET